MDDNRIALDRLNERAQAWCAAGYNIIAFPLDAGLSYPLTAWLLSPRSPPSLSGSTLIVVANAVLLKRVKMAESAAA